VVTSAGQINQISAEDLDTGIEEVYAAGDGRVDPNFVAAILQAPRGTLSTMAIVRALGFVPMAGLAINGTAIGFYFQQYAQGSTRDANGALKVSMDDGLIVPVSIEADQRQASITYEVIGRTNDGTTNPLAVAIDQALPALTAADQWFVAGPASINGTAIDSVETVRVDFGIQTISVASNGLPYPRFVAVQARQPSIVIGCRDPELLNTLGVGGVAQGVTDSLVYLRKCAANGARVADNVAEHLKLSIDQGRIQVSRLGGAEGNCEVRISPTYDGTADIVAVTAGAAIA
jgi:hypothetical protein